MIEAIKKSAPWLTACLITAGIAMFVLHFVGGIWIKDAQRKIKEKNIAEGSLIESINEKAPISNGIEFDTKNCIITVSSGCFFSMEDSRITTEFKKACEGEEIKAVDLAGISMNVEAPGCK